MKKIIIPVIVICLAIGGAAFALIKHNNDEKLKDTLNEASISYFKDYISTNSSTSVYPVTLEMLEEANKNGEKYTLNGLETCNKKETLTQITVNFKDGTPAKAEATLSCK